MPKLPVLSSKRIIAILEQNGFRLKRSSGSHFIFGNPITGRRYSTTSHERSSKRNIALNSQTSWNYKRRNIEPYKEKAMGLRSKKMGHQIITSSSSSSSCQ